MFLLLDRIREILGTPSTGVPDAPSDTRTYGRKAAVWLDVENITDISTSSTLLDFNNSQWDILTGNYSAENVPFPSLINSPFTTQVGQVYSYIIECIAGVVSHEQRMTVFSTQWAGERVYVRQVFDSPPTITKARWKSLLSLYTDIRCTDTVGNAFQTVHAHTLQADTQEQINFQVYGKEDAPGTNSALFEVAVTAENIAGATTVLGATVVVQHKSVGAVFVGVIDDGSDTIFVQVKPTNSAWKWRSESESNEIVLT